MASVIDICNLALSHLGEIPNLSSIDPPEGSAHAEKCARFYPIARDVALEMRNWSFALKRVKLATLPNDNTRWTFRYRRPSDCLRPIAIPQPDLGYAGVFSVQGDVLARQMNSADFTTEQDSIYTDAPEAELQYLFRVTDTTKFPPLFTSAVAWLLASYLAGAITRDMDVKQWAYQMFEQQLSLSAQSVANGSQTTNTHTAAWMRNR